MRELSRSVYEVNVYGREQKLTAPTSKQTIEYMEKTAKVDTEKDFQAMYLNAVSFLCACGLEEEVASELEMNHLVELVSLVKGDEKK